MTEPMHPRLTTSRRRFLAGAAAAALLPLPAALPAAETQQPLPFDFETLTEAARQRAAGDPVAPRPLPEIFAGLKYDDYQLIWFPPERARWGEETSAWRVLPFHLGWLFTEPVEIFEVAGGMAAPMPFTTDDFQYRGHLEKAVPPDFQLPGVAGFKLNHPMNRADAMDEVISFIGASYFRALGLGNAYGTSARGLAIDSALGRAEEFPRFTAFWLEKPAPGAGTATVYAALDSDSAAGAFRFEIRPGVTTTVDVTARLFFRRDVEQLGIAPLTSMFLFSDVNRARFDDFRPRVHDANGLRIVREDGDVIWRALDNPSRLASSYYSETRPRRFGLHQRGRDFEDYADPVARYDLRPSVEVEPLDDWGSGAVRLFELPTDLEIHDNIGAFWIPEAPVRAGEAREFRYRLHWGRLEPDPDDDRARVVATRSGIGGASGLEEPPDTRKFVVDFRGGMLGRMPDGDPEIAPVVDVVGGTAEVVVLTRIAGTSAAGEGTWRLVIDVAAEPGALVEMTAHVAGYGRKLTEIWSFQWVRA